MASRKKLKQTIKFVTAELVTEIYFRCLTRKDIDEQKVENLMLVIEDFRKEFVARANHPDGKDNPKLVKSYFKSYYADWSAKMEKIIGEIESI